MSLSLVTSAASGAKMTSLQIAELVGVRHDNVKRTVDRLVSRAVIEFPPMEEISTATKPLQIYVFDVARKLDTIIVVAQLSPEFTAALVKRWDTLEQRQLAALDPFIHWVDTAGAAGRKINETSHIKAQMLRQALKEAGCSDAYRGGRNGEALYFRASASVALMGVLSPHSLVSERPQQLGKMIERVRNGLSAIEEAKAFQLY